MRAYACVSFLRSCFSLFIVIIPFSTHTALVVVAAADPCTRAFAHSKHVCARVCVCVCVCSALRTTTTTGGKPDGAPMNIDKLAYSVTKQEVVNSVVETHVYLHLASSSSISARVTYFQSALDFACTRFRDRMSSSPE